MSISQPGHGLLLVGIGNRSVVLVRNQLHIFYLIMHRTPWTKKASSVPSDRIKATPNLSNTASKSKGKGKQLAPPDPPKSKDVQRLEALIRDIKSSTGKEKDPTGGCFCLGQLFSRFNISQRII